MSRVCIVTDSTSDVPREVASRLGITVVPAYVQIGDRSYRDDGRLSREEFYAKLPTMAAVPTTSVPPSGEFARAYRGLVGEADEVMAIVISKNLSGMYNVAHLAAQEVPQLGVCVVDSHQVTMGLGWTVIAAAEAAAGGKSVEEILDLIEGLKRRVYVYAALDTLEYVRRSGRVSWARAKAAEILRLKPIVEMVGGKVRDIGRVRRRREAVDRLEELTPALEPLERLAILHTDSPEVAEMRHRLDDLCSPDQLMTAVIATIIGVHVGPRGLGVAAVAAG